MPATERQGTLSVQGAPCGEAWCISDVFPAGFAWSEGVRPGDRILRIDGQPASVVGPFVEWREVSSIAVESGSGQLVSANLQRQAIGESPLKWSLWFLGGFFAVLGSLVWYRRPDLGSAVALGRMATVAGAALTVGPAAGGRAFEWALAIQAIAIIFLGFTFFDFTFQLTQEHRPNGRLVVIGRSLLGWLTLAIFVAYLASITVSSNLYEPTRAAFHLTLAGSLLLSVALLSWTVVHAPGGSEANRLRVPLLGMVLGAPPFPLISLVPLALGRDAPLPPHVTVLPVLLIPSAFAYSILHDQLWGIRRLVHRGLVYTLLTAAVLGLVVGGVLLTDLTFGSSIARSGREMLVIAALVVAGITVYSPLRRGIRSIVDRLIYGPTPDYPEFVHGLQRDITSANPESELPQTICTVFADRLGLEAAVLLRHDEEGQTGVAASVGDAVPRVLDALETDRLRLPTADNPDTPTVVPFEGEQVLAMQLWAASERMGTILLGPKRGGDLFIQDEVNLVMNAAPFMAAALERHEVSQTMRLLNRRLVETDERSRQRMAVDLHDGPLQKAVALAMGRIEDPVDQKEMATDLVTELREIGSRLRPSILDDLGLPSSIEWLLEHNMRGTDIRGTLVLDGMDEDQRLDPDVELALFRVTQEAINNAVKHSNASELRVSLEYDGEQVTLTVRDNGVGIGGAGSGKIASSRLGLVGMRERVLQAGGHLEVHSQPGRGVFIQAIMSIEGEAER